ncbi:MAG: T9SS type A sorting domain-containing protein [candidate division KSB1 bacterium]|nr:T9SS type A sorting domain-containing protein [candidate division KSB1 bacterium]
MIIQLIPRRALIIAIFLSQFVNAGAQHAATVVSSSRTPMATAYNSGRRLVRDSQDHRYVVYQDLRGDLPIICFATSANGKIWSIPDTLAPGAFPSLAIDQADRLYLVWQAFDASGIYFTYSNDSGKSWKFPLWMLSQAGSGKTRFPVVEAGRRRVHFAWQQEEMQMGHQRQQIFYTSMALDSLDSFGPAPMNVSQTQADAKFPSMAHNLAFDEGRLHLVWYDSTNTDNSTMTSIMYRAVDETLGVWQPPLSTSPSLLSDNCGGDCVHPAVSVGFSEFAHVVWGHSQRDRFHSFLIDPYSFSHTHPVEIRTQADPFICIDDVYLKSSALVWGAENEIYYVQSRDGIPISNDFILLSQPDEISSKYPSVCYKHFDPDSLDVVWTEGNIPPYRIMYCRMKKTYGYQEVGRNETENQLPQQLMLRQNYPNPFNVATTIRYDLPRSSFVTLEIYNFLSQKVRTLVAENQLTGEYQINWDGHDDSGNLVPSGIYLCQLKGDHQILTRKIVLIK